MDATGTTTAVRAKLHGLRITDAHLDYQGSVTLDPDHCDAVGIMPLEFVEIWNKHSGARLSTYVIWGKRGSRCCVLNGAAARTCQPGDSVIIVAHTTLAPSAIEQLRPRVALFDAANRIERLLEYRLGRDALGQLTFRTARLRAARPGTRRRTRRAG